MMCEACRNNYENVCLIHYSTTEKMHLCESCAENIKITIEAKSASNSDITETLKRIIGDDNYMDIVDLVMGQYCSFSSELQTYHETPHLY